MLGYELWDTLSRNLLADFESEDEALEAVRALIAVDGSACTDALALTRVDGAGQMTTLASGEALALRAGVAAPQRGRRAT